MKRIFYKICNRANIGTEEQPEWTENLFDKSIPYSEANEAIAAAEAYNGQYTIEDDEQPEPQPADAERIAELEATINALLGVNE